MREEWRKGVNERGIDGANGVREGVMNKKGIENLRLRLAVIHLEKKLLRHRCLCQNHRQQTHPSDSHRLVQHQEASSLHLLDQNHHHHRRLINQEPEAV